MQNPQGQVLSIHPDAAGTRVLVAVAAESACARCAAGKGCGAGLLGGSPGDSRVAAIAPAELDLRQGDEVRIALQPRNVLRAALIVYGYPLLGALLAALLAYGLGFADPAAAGAALSGIVLGVVIARWRLNETRCLRDFTPVVVEVLETAAD